MTPNIVPYAMNRQQVKSMLGITDASKDADIDAFLPIVTDDLFRINGILNQSFFITARGDVTTGSDTITNIATVGIRPLAELRSMYAVGNVIEAPGFDTGPDAPVIVSVGENEIQLSAVATATEQEARIEARTLPIGVHQTVAQMVMFRIESAMPVSTGKSGGVASRSIGPTSITYDTANASSGSSGYPRRLVSDLALVKRPRFF